MSISIGVGAIALVLLVGCDESSTTSLDSGMRPRADSGSPREDAGPRPDGSAPRADGGTVALDAGPPIGSAGCGRVDPPSGARTIEVEGQTGNYIVSLPATYDPSRPYPMGFGFHGFGRSHENCQDGDCAGFQRAMEDEAVLVYIKSFSDGWEDSAVRDRNAALFEAVLDTMLAEYCVESGRVFVAGTSSGAHFANVLACRYGDRLIATVPVAGYLPERDCVGHVSALVIHGVDDGSFEAGQDARDFYGQRDGCEPITGLEALHDRVSAARESHECVDYTGCDDGLLVRWCAHSEGGYDGSTHGWPQFGGEEIWDFVSSLPRR